MKLRFVLLIVIGLGIRLFLVDRWPAGDLYAYAEWGRKFWEYGSHKFYYGGDWLYSIPNYPPIGSLLFAAAYWLFEHRYVLAQIHNSTHLIPAFFIKYFYESGYFLLLKLPAILADLLLGYVVYRTVLALTKDTRRAIFGFCVYFLNPVAIFLSGVWGQIDSTVSLFGFSAFLLLATGHFSLSLPLLFISLYTKLSWMIFLPFYLFLIFLWRPKIYQFFVGVLLSVIVFYFSTLPFVKDNNEKPLFVKTLDYAVNDLTGRFRFAFQDTPKATVSAFNFHAAFLKMDRDLETSRILGVQANVIGFLAYAIINAGVFLYVKKWKNRIFAVVYGLFTIGFGSFLFLTNMLERYFFSSFAPMVVLLITRPKILAWAVLVNIIVFANLIFAFFRRTSDEIGRPFLDNNFLLIRILSLLNLVTWFNILRKARQR